MNSAHLDAIKAAIDTVTHALGRGCRSLYHEVMFDGAAKTISMGDRFYLYVTGLAKQPENLDNPQLTLYLSAALVRARESSELKFLCAHQGDLFTRHDVELEVSIDASKRYVATVKNFAERAAQAAERVRQQWQKEDEAKDAAAEAAMLGFGDNENQRVINGHPVTMSLRAPGMQDTCREVSLQIDKLRPDIARKILDILEFEQAAQ